MKNFYSCFVLLALASIFSKTTIAQFCYLNPLPGSVNHNKQTTITIRNGNEIDESSIHYRKLFDITGTVSGVHGYTASLCRDRKTIILKPQSIFADGETIVVTIHDRLRTKEGGRINGKTFSFQIRSEITPEQKKRNAELDSMINAEEFSNDPQLEMRDLNLDSLPAYTITTNNNAAPGEIFYNNQSDFNPAYTNCFNTIIENTGSVTWAKDMGANGHDFKINYNGYLTYWDFNKNYWFVMDSNYNVIDSLYPGNGYETKANPHDVSVYPDGHVILLVTEKQDVDLSAYGGSAACNVEGVIVQELDADRNVVFEWNSFDHFQITDAESHISLTNSFLDWVHANTASRDVDGNILLSCRNFCEVTKIDFNTGEIIWRLGGEKNQFTFVNDSTQNNFNYQHDARRIENGNLLMYNNGKFQSPQRSSAKEYRLDEVNKIATLVWYYEHPDVAGQHVYGPATGSAQRLPNGNTMICWGTVSGNVDRPSMTEVDSLKNITWEMKFDAYGDKCYRVHKYEWNPCALVNTEHVTVKKITSTSAKVSWNSVKNATAYDLQYRKLGNTTWKLKNTTNTSKKLINLSPAKSYEYQLRSYCTNGYVSDWCSLDTFATLPARYLLNVNEDKFSFSIYPNPAQQYLFIASDSEFEGNAEVNIFDLEGRLILTIRKTVIAGEKEIKIDVSILHSGVFIAEIKSNCINQKFKFVKE
ncbi:MAG: aryl-sulfate sulfotransferase [Chitinophagales bacterium]|nr:aryl-sulfate sulfotransferase [Chitinophagales bacterium]